MMTEPDVASTTSAADTPLLAVRNVTKHFPLRDGVMQRVSGQVRAVDGVSFDLRRGETLGLVGESGCGKTTLGRLVAGLTSPTSGGVYIDLDAASDRALADEHALGSDPDQRSARLDQLEATHRIDRLKGSAQRTYRRNCQMVFQDSFASLNPRHLVRDIIGRPMRVYKEASGSALTERVVELLELVGLGRQHLYRYPHQFSGGQRQRISIARALALDPELIVLDEPTSALDVSVQAQVLNLLHDLQAERGLTYLFITHDLSVVRHMAERIVVMYLGRVAEASDVEPLFDRQYHPYTHALLRANPDLDDDGEGFRGLEGNVPDPARPPSGCRFHTRCSYATAACGWEIDDVVRRLEDVPEMFDELVGVERSTRFDAKLEFSDPASARRLADALRNGSVPSSMQAAIEDLAVTDEAVRVRFTPVPDVELTDRPNGRTAACVLDEFDPDETSRD